MNVWKGTADMVRSDDWMMQPAITKKQLGRLQDIIASCCARHTKGKASQKQAKHSISGHKGAGHFTASVKLPATLPKSVRAEVRHLLALSLAAPAKTEKSTQV